MLAKFYRNIVRAYEVIKVSAYLASVWTFQEWLHFWTTFDKETIINVKEIKLVVRTGNIFSKATDISMIYECIVRDDYKINSLSNKNGSIIDVGAHLGSFSLFASKKCPKCKIYSFEPSPSTYAVLKKNIELNQSGNIIIFNKAVTSGSKPVRIYINPINSALNTIYDNKGRSVEISSVSLQKIFTENSIKNCDFLKMDCEGAEYNILLNTPLKILKKIKKMVIEYHNPDYFGIKNKKLNLDNLLKYLKKAGFSCTIKKVKDYQGVLVAER
ncbi:MAG: FkbM family methyltransferase [Nanoarchaeota archaeon]